MAIVDILTTIILFGGIQAISLWLFLSFKKSENKTATRSLSCSFFEDPLQDKNIEAAIQFIAGCK